MENGVETFGFITQIYRYLVLSDNTADWVKDKYKDLKYECI